MTVLSMIEVNAPRAVCGCEPCVDASCLWIYYTLIIIRQQEVELCFLLWEQVNHNHSLVWQDSHTFPENLKMLLCCCNVLENSLNTGTPCTCCHGNHLGF